MNCYYCDNETPYGSSLCQECLDEQVSETCNACGDYFDTLADYEAHDCADTMGE